MTIYSLYIFDRHCECVYYQSWHRTTPIRPGKDVLANVAPGTRLPSESSEEEEVAQQEAVKNATTDMSNLKINEYTGIPRAPGLAVLPSTSASSRTQSQTYDIKEDEEGSGTIPQQGKRGLPFDEECKLVYGVLFSLRSMMKKLSKKEDEAFISYKTSTYKLHLYETISGYKFILFTDSKVESLKYILVQIYQVCFIEFVVRSPLIEDIDSRISGKGIDSMAFRMSVHKFISGLPIFR